MYGIEAEVECPTPSSLPPGDKPLALDFLLPVTIIGSKDGVKRLEQPSRLVTKQNSN